MHIHQFPFHSSFLPSQGDKNINSQPPNPEMGVGDDSMCRSSIYVIMIDLSSFKLVQSDRLHQWHSSGLALPILT